MFALDDSAGSVGTWSVLSVGHCSPGWGRPLVTANSTWALEAVQVLHSWRVSVAPVAGAGCVAGPGEASFADRLPSQEGCPDETNHSKAENMGK